MFSETIFNTNIVATREISASRAESMLVNIYKIEGLLVVPEMLRTTWVLSRTFEGEMPAMIRHSANWIQKLEREQPRSEYWLECMQDYGRGCSGWKVFLRQPQVTVDFINRVQREFGSAVMGAAPQARVLSTAQVTTAFQRALDSGLPIGSTHLRQPIMNAFVEALRA